MMESTLTRLTQAELIISNILRNNQYSQEQIHTLKNLLQDNKPFLSLPEPVTIEGLSQLRNQLINLTSSHAGK